MANFVKPSIDKLLKRLENHSTTVKYNCPVDKIKCFVHELDLVNGAHYYGFYNNYDDAIAFTMKELLHADKTIDDFILKDDNSILDKNGKFYQGGFLEEKDNKLYYHWVYYGHEDPLFDSDDKPKNKEELIKYLKEGNRLKICTHTRAPVYISVLNTITANVYLADQPDAGKLYNFDLGERDLFECVGVEEDVKHYNAGCCESKKIDGVDYMFNPDEFACKGGSDALCAFDENPQLCNVLFTVVNYTF
jgi:hypothetical protein